MATFIDAVVICPICHASFPVIELITDPVAEDDVPVMTCDNCDTPVANMPVIKERKSK
jgi:hypothetical protein